MTKASPLTVTVQRQLAALLDGPPDAARLASALRLLAKWRSSLIANTLRQSVGATIPHGPFAGMTYDVDASEGAFAARLLGAYEASLAPVIEAIIARADPLVIDVGCAEGYYAVGLARRMPETTVWARDASDRAQALCAELARRNGVADRVQVGGLLTHADLAVCADGPVTIVCDIEGAEEALLDPAAAPALSRAAILVEVHDGFVPGLSDRLAARFAPTHAVTRIGRTLAPAALPAAAEAWSDMDRLLALWEWRAGPTPWLWMVPQA